MSLLIFALAFVLDLWLGDPPHWPHPVRWIGWLISRLERLIRVLCPSQSTLYLGGGLLWLMVVGSSFALSWALIALCQAIHPWLSWALQLWLAYTLLATRCLRDAAMAVYQALHAEDLALSRERLSWIVGRDTKALQPPQIIRATVETVAENAVDGVIAPLVWLFVGGVPLAMAYKAVNTLDSMVGYRNERFAALGFVSAKLDDLANLLPARLSWLLFTLAAALLRQDAWAALCIGWRDRYAHKSPNCAWSEAAVAGALGVRLGGPNVYFGERVEKPWLGDPRREIECEDIPRTIRLMYLVSCLALGLFCLVHQFLA